MSFMYNPYPFHDLKAVNRPELSKKTLESIIAGGTPNVVKQFVKGIADRAKKEGIIVAFDGYTTAKWDLFISLMAGLVTKLPAPLYEDNLALSDSFNALFGLAPRTAVASLLAFFAGSTVNARIMSLMKERAGDKGFGWRAILSSLGGESVDSLIFFPIVFAGIMPIMGIITLVLTQVVCKTLYELVVLPLTAIIVRILKKKENEPSYE